MLKRQGGFTKDYLECRSLANSVRTKFWSKGGQASGQKDKPDRAAWPASKPLVLRSFSPEYYDFSFSLTV